MSMSKEEAMEMLIERGMEETEAKKFMGAKAGELITKGLQLPADQALDIMIEMSRYGVLTGPVRFYIVVTKDNEQRLLDELKVTGEEPIVLAAIKPDDIGEDPIGDYNRTIQDGFSGDAGLRGDPTKMPS